MNIENLFTKVSQLISQQPVRTGLFTALAAALIVALIVLFRSGVVGKAVMSRQRSPFVRLMELVGAMVSAVVLIDLLYLNLSAQVWIGVSVVFVLAGYLSWRFLRWGEDGH